MFLPVGINIFLFVDQRREQVSIRNLTLGSKSLGLSKMDSREMNMQTKGFCVARVLQGVFVKPLKTEMER